VEILSGAATAMECNAAQIYGETQSALAKPASTTHTLQRFYFNPALIWYHVLNGSERLECECIRWVLGVCLGCNFTLNEPSGCNTNPRVRNGVYQDISF